ncbi:MAG: dihydropteroate synthase [Verrucomicrobiaceae bacterium]|nr:dihydropteroate synthase [Verrucomicrobiaceae bacterium]
MNWRIGNRTLDLTQRGLIMGIVNVTPDSFSDGGRFTDPGRAVEHALAMIAEGADILDIGGESTRPGAEPVPEAEELRRVLPVIRAIRTQTPVLISIDTMKASVARAALDAGADIINDVTGLRGDAGMVRLAAETNCGLVAMHMTGDPQTMQHAPRYDDVVAEVRAYLEDRLRILSSAGIDPARVVLDPGFGFGKTLEHNLALLRELPRLVIADRPLLVGVSRKSMIAKVLNSTDMADRHWPTVALTAFAREHGARIIRVHDVRPNREALRMIEAILGHHEG